MISSKVYFTNLRTTSTNNLLDKLRNLVYKAGIKNIDFNKKFAAIKIHFGEPGNLSYIRHNYAAEVVRIIANLGGVPYLSDCNTLYSGRRSNAISHLESAMENGFNPLSVHCPVIIGDGLKGTDYREIEINQEYCKSAKIGTAIADSDIIVTMTHFKGHEQAGFGGTLKNTGMGCASVPGKMELHSSSQPVINTKNCTGCNICVKNCAHNALILNEFHKAVIDGSKCVGCGQCIAYCQYDAAQVANWSNSVDMNRKIAEYAFAVLNAKPHFHISFIMNVSPNCDCWGNNDASLIPDLGIVASFDPVAIDMACADLVKQSPALANNALSDHYPDDSLCGCDKFKLVHPNTDWMEGLIHAQKMGLGNIEYELIKV